MFGKIVLGVDGDLFEHALSEAKLHAKAKLDTDLTAEDLKNVVAGFKKIIRAETGADFPADPYIQLEEAIKAVFRSWNGDRAKAYRRREKIPDNLGTAVNIVTMVFGNMGKTRVPVWLSREIRPRAKKSCSAITCPTRRARMLWPASARRSTSMS